MTVARGRLIRGGSVASSPPIGAGARVSDAVSQAAALAVRASALAGDRDEAALDRVVDLARLLAERLLRKSIELSPETIASLAAAVLAEARSARRVAVFVHPSHVPLLEHATQAFDPEGRVHRIAGDASLGSCDVRLETELGNVDARIDVGLTELARRLRDALRS